MLKDTKRKITLILVSVLLIIAAPLYLGCGPEYTSEFAEGEELTIYVNQTYKFNLTSAYVDSYGIILEVTGDDNAIKGLKPGMETVTLHDEDYGKKQDEITVHVVEPEKKDLFEQYTSFPTTISVEVGKTNTEISSALPTNEITSLSVIDAGTATVSEDGTVTGVAKGTTAVEIVIYNSAEPSICYAANITVDVTEQDTDEDNDDTPTEGGDTPTEDDTETAGNSIVYLGSYSGTIVVNTSVTLQAFDGLFAANYVPNQYQPSELSFSSDNQSIATVDANGVITGVSVGTTIINVTKGAFADSNPITKYRVTVRSATQANLNLPPYITVYLDNPQYLLPILTSDLGQYSVSSVSSYNNPGTTGGLTDLSIADNVGGQLLSFTATNVGEVMIQFSLSLSGTNISIPYHLIVNVKETTPVQPAPTPTPAPAPEEDDAMTPEDEAGTP